MTFNQHGNQGIGALIESLSRMGMGARDPFAMQVSDTPDRVAAYTPGDKYKMMSADPYGAYPPSDPVPYIRDPEALHAHQTEYYQRELADVNARIAKTTPGSPEYYELQKRRTEIQGNM